MLWALLCTASPTTTTTRRDNPRRTRHGIGKRKNTKRAIVTLKAGTIDIFSNVG